MGIYLNPGNQGFAESINSQIYVDKTGLISYTNRVIMAGNASPGSCLKGWQLRRTPHLKSILISTTLFSLICRIF